MIFQILLGSALICLCIVIQTFFIGTAATALEKKADWLTGQQPLLHRSIALSAVTFWLVLSLTIAIWTWAVLFVLLGVFATMEEALYFSIVAFTTLGFGDIIIDGHWRLLSGFLAANGLIMFSLCTAFLIEFLSALRRAQLDKAQASPRKN